MSNKTHFQMLDDTAGDLIPDTIDLMPRIAAQLNERKSLMQIFRARPVLVMVIAILAFLVLSGVAYAIGKVMGYIPGIGMIDQSTQLRVLAEPISVTRDGITLTVEQVVLSADKTVLVYQIEGIPEDAYAPWEENTSNSYSSVVTTEGTPEDRPVTTESSSCIPDVYLLLPDGSTLHMHTAEGNGWMTGFENRSVYGPLPAGVNEVTLIMPCVEGTLVGRLPENWEVPLRFESAPSDMIVLPVVEVTPSTSDASRSAMTLEQVIETNDGYIVTGKFQSTALPLNAKALGISDWITITDANGQVVEARPPTSLDLASNVYGEFYWAYEIQGKQHAFPLTFTLDGVSADIPDATVEFEFDLGADPKVGQVWNLNKELEIAGYAIEVVSIERLEKGYSFIFQADPDVIGVNVEIDHEPFSSASAGNDGYGMGNLFYIVEYAGDVPSGKVTIQLNWLQAEIPGPWQVEWSPESISPTP